MKNIHESEIQKVLDVVNRALNFHIHRDDMNANLHLADQVRLSPLTSELSSAQIRLNKWLAESPGKE